MSARGFTRFAGMGMLAISATIVQASFVNSASAGVPAGTQAVRVSDLDLSKSADVARLYQRIRNAAAAACGADELTGTRLPTTGQRHCMDEAVGTAVEHVHNAQLSAYHQQEIKAPRAAPERRGSGGKESLPGVTRKDSDRS